MLVTNVFSKVIERSFEDAAELTPEERLLVLRHISSCESRYQDYDALVNGQPKKASVPPILTTRWFAISGRSAARATRRKT